MPLSQDSEFVQCVYCHVVLSDSVKHAHMCPPFNQQRRRRGEPAVFDVALDPIKYPNQKPVTTIRDYRDVDPGAGQGLDNLQGLQE